MLKFVVVILVIVSLVIVIIVMVIRCVDVCDDTGDGYDRGKDGGLVVGGQGNGSDDCRCGDALNGDAYAVDGDCGCCKR
jgi:hypothetical protein